MSGASVTMPERPGDHVPKPGACGRVPKGGRTVNAYEDAAKRFGGTIADSAVPDYQALAAKFGGKPAVPEQGIVDRAGQWLSKRSARTEIFAARQSEGHAQAWPTRLPGRVGFAANIPGVRGFVGDDVNAGIKAKEAEYEAARALWPFRIRRCARWPETLRRKQCRAGVPDSGRGGDVGEGRYRGCSRSCWRYGDSGSRRRELLAKHCTEGRHRWSCRGRTGACCRRSWRRYRAHRRTVPWASCRASADPWATWEPPDRHATLRKAANEAGRSISDIPQSLLEAAAVLEHSMRCRRDRIWIPLRRCERQTLRRSGSSRFSGRSPATRCSLPGEESTRHCRGRRADRCATGGTD